ncbi:MAG: hypothetical protein V8T36_07730 [Ruthenibacterium lactatiformans]
MCAHAHSGGLAAGLIFQAIYKAEGSRRIGLSFAASLAGPSFEHRFLHGHPGGLLLFSEYIQGLAQSMGAANPFTFAASFVGVQGIVEAVVGFGLHCYFKRRLGATHRNH